MFHDRPTIFLMVNRGFTPRFLLRTEIFRTLKSASVNVVILATNADDEYFRREFAGPNVFIERFREELCSAYFKRSRIQHVLRILRSMVMSDRGDLTTARQLERIHLADLTAKGGVRRQVVAAAVWFAARCLRRSHFLRRLLIWYETTCFNPSFHGDLFTKYRPELVVTTSLGNPMAGWDPYIMREARQHGAKVAAVILSWDNPSSKGLRGGAVDYVIGWTGVMRDELVTYHDLDPNRIWTCGPPHWDVYYQTPPIGREELFREFRLDPARKVIFFGTKAPAAYAWNADIAEIIARAIEEGRLCEPCQLLVRVHPLHYRPRYNAVGVQVVSDTLSRYRELEATYPHIRFDYPEIISSTLDMPDREIHKLAAILRSSAVTVNIHSTLNIEAAIYDCPIVNVSFNGDGGVPPDARKDAALDEVQPHNQRIIRSGGVTQARSAEQLIAAINSDLRDPAQRAEGRRRIRMTEAGERAGEAGRAIAEHLLEFAAGRLPQPSAPRAHDLVCSCVVLTS